MVTSALDAASALAERDSSARGTGGGRDPGADGHRYPLSSSPGRYRPGPSPDPDKEISTIRLFCRIDLRSGPDLHFDPGVWQRVSSYELIEPLPRHSRSLASSVE